MDDNGAVASGAPNPSYKQHIKTMIIYLFNLDFKLNTSYFKIFNFFIEYIIYFLKSRSNIRFNFLKKSEFNTD